MSDELYRPKINPELQKMAQTPLAQSLLYDLDLLPEQLASQEKMTVGLFAAYCRLEGVLMAFKAIEIQEESEPPMPERVDLDRIRELEGELAQARKEINRLRDNHPIGFHTYDFSKEEFPARPSVDSDASIYPLKGRVIFVTDDSGNLDLIETTAKGDENS